MIRFECDSLEEWMALSEKLRSCGIAEKITDETFEDCDECCECEDFDDEKMDRLNDVIFQYVEQISDLSGNHICKSHLADMLFDFIIEYNDELFDYKED